MTLGALFGLLGDLASVSDAAKDLVHPAVPVVVSAANGEEPSTDDLFDLIMEYAKFPIPFWEQAVEYTKDKGIENTEEYVERGQKAADDAYYRKREVTTGADGVPRFADGTEAELVDPEKNIWRPKK